MTCGSGIPSPEEEGPPTTSGGASYSIGSSSGRGATYGDSAHGTEATPLQGEQGQGAGAEGGTQRYRAEAFPRVRRRLRRPEQRAHVRGVRLSDGELATIRAAAASCGLTVAGFIGQAAVAAARSDAPAARIADDRALIEELFRVRRHLAHLGNNCNQIARALNAGARETIGLTPLVAALSATVARADRAVSRVLDRDR